MNAILFVDGAAAGRPQAPARSSGKPGEAAESAAGALFAVLLQQAVNGPAPTIPAEGGHAAAAGGDGGAGAEASGGAGSVPAPAQAAAQRVEMPLPAGTAPAAEASVTGAAANSPAASTETAPAEAGTPSQATALAGVTEPKPAGHQPAEPQPTQPLLTAPKAGMAESAGAGASVTGTSLPASRGGAQDPGAPQVKPEETVQADGQTVRTVRPQAGRADQEGVPAVTAADGTQDVGAGAADADIAERKTAVLDQAAQPAAPEGKQASGSTPAGPASHAQAESGRREASDGPRTQERAGAGRRAEPPLLSQDGGTVFSPQAAPNPRNMAATALQTTAAPAAAQPRDILNQVISRVKVSLQGDRTEARIHLMPEHLGPVDLKVTVDGGQLTAHFHVASGQVKEILEQHLPELKQALHDQGFKVEQFSISMGTSSAQQDLGLGQQAQSQAQAWQARTAHYGRYREEAAQPIVAAVRQEANGAARRRDLIA
ncbi:MAG: flagellar hook-length control protein FliK [Bacillota bacterium]